MFVIKGYNSTTTWQIVAMLSYLTYLGKSVYRVSIKKKYAHVVVWKARWHFMNRFFSAIFNEAFSSPDHKTFFKIYSKMPTGL